MKHEACWFCESLYGVWILSNQSIALLWADVLSLSSVHTILCLPQLNTTKQGDWSAERPTEWSRCQNTVSIDCNASKNLHIGVAFNITFFELAQHLSDLYPSMTSHFVRLFVKCERVPLASMRMRDTMMAMVILGPWSTFTEHEGQLCMPRLWAFLHVTVF